MSQAGRPRCLPRNFAIIINASCLFVSPCHHQFLTFQWVVMTPINTIYLLPHPAIQRWLGHPFISLQISDLRACGRRPQNRVMIGSPSRIRSRRWSGCSGGTYRHGSAGAIVCTMHISKIIGEFMLGSFRFRISDCIPWLSLGQRHRPYRRPARLAFRTIDRIFHPQQDDRGRRL
ncbi:hypothetical protein PVAP13_1NG342319 [Panicum virgatum]|uniref:Uncharacterized protein n=1 Tax=Panicum virgatum TaxID=38727 RepID=A0A8T0WYD2_PANVG|nr:hypothetical protein PVAP13_1NG342319 [Panicum virgatum]